MGNWKGWSQSPDEISFKYNKLKQNKKIKKQFKKQGQTRVFFLENNIKWGSDYQTAEYGIHSKTEYIFQICLQCRPNL